MAHPKMYDDGDPHFQRVRALALALPAADMKVSHGRPAFFTQKVFAYYGASVKDSDNTRDRSRPAAAGDGYVQHPQAVVIKPEEADISFLEQDPRTFRPAYLGRSGWFGIDVDGLDPAQDEGWDEIAEWLETSYRLTAPLRMVRDLPLRE
ncbi:MmcQ/YjbR family DNA-binding protein [Citricoccus sp. NPDC079358]|jgi:predicted DNA-binding protein (MmcQ/YjbR family)|uniref:MmcQ/YjbR family DNA-binding protein n=1 Tax=Citricoccus sp. NPDC079358 TaxID=3154653 RepID=UPI00344D630D